MVLATGGLSFPRTGSDGVGYALARSLGHALAPPVPALTPLVASDPRCREAQGVAVEAALTLRIAGRKPVTVAGPLLFTHFGYSGPAALDLSRHWHRAEGAGERRIEARLVPGETRERLEAAWLAAAGSTPRRTVRRQLAERLPERLVVLACGEAAVDPDTPLGQVARLPRAGCWGGWWHDRSLSRGRSATRRPR